MDYNVYYRHVNEAFEQHFIDIDDDIMYRRCCGEKIKKYDWTKKFQMFMEKNKESIEDFVESLIRSELSIDDIPESVEDYLRNMKNEVINYDYVLK